MYTSFLNVCRRLKLFPETPVSTNQTINAYNEEHMQTKLKFKVHTQTRQEPRHAMHTSFYKRLQTS